MTNKLSVSNKLSVFKKLSKETISILETINQPIDWPEMIQEIQSYLVLTDTELAYHLGIAYNSLYNYKKRLACPNANNACKLTKLYILCGGI